MDMFLTNINIKILLTNEKKLSKENEKLQRFVFDGEIRFIDDSYVKAFTNKALNYSNYVNIMLQISKDVISPKVNAIGSFENLKQETIKTNLKIGDPPTDLLNKTIFINANRKINKIKIFKYLNICFKLYKNTYKFKFQLKKI